jgi:outer membrane lipoprotein SlyB
MEFAMKLIRSHLSAVTLIALFAASIALALPAQAQAKCDNCGTITDVKTIKKEGEGSGVGAVAGGVIGGVLGHQVGSGRGNTAATIVGAGAGAYAGNQVEKNQKTTTTYQVVAKMEDGKSRTFNFSKETSFRVGDKIKVVDGKLVRE